MKRMLILLLLLAMAAGCTSSPKAAAGSTAPRKEPPALTVRLGAAETQATLSTWSWDWPNPDGTRTGVEADGLHPLDLPDYMTPIPAGDGGTLKLSFDLGPLTLDHLTLRRWDLSAAGDPTKYESGFETLSFTVDGGTVTVELPDGRGGIFEVHAYFLGESRGDGWYGFCLQDDPDRAAAFRVQTVRIGWREGLSELPRVRVARSRTALSDALAAETVWGDMPDRDDPWFIDRELLLILLEEGSGSISHEVTEVLEAPSGVTVTVRRIVPEVCTADMAAWLLLVDLPAGTVPENDPVTLRIL